MYSEIEKEAALLAEELCEAAKLRRGQTVVVGCSTSEVCGSRIGTASVPEAADALYRGLKSVFAPRGIFIAARCTDENAAAVWRISDSGCNATDRMQIFFQFHCPIIHSFIGRNFINFHERPPL